MADVVESARKEARELAERAGIDMLDDHDQFVTDLTETLVRFARLSQAGAGGAVVSTEPTCWTSEVSLRMAAEGVPAVIHAYPPPVEPVALYRTPPAPVQTASVEAVCELRDRVLEALTWSPGDTPGDIVMRAREAAQSVASLTAPTQGDGDWLLVPLKPTDEMVRAGAKGRQNSARASFEDGWKLALAVAPKPTPSSPVSSPSPAGGVREAGFKSGLEAAAEYLLACDDYGDRLKAAEIRKLTPPASAPADAREAMAAFDKLIRYGARSNYDGNLQAPNGTLFRFDDREAFFLSDIDRDAILAALSSPATGEVVDPGDLQLLFRLKQDNRHDGARPVIEKDQKAWEQAFRLSDAGLIAIEQIAAGGVLHITRKGVAAVAAALNPAPGHGEGGL
ncbi:hypothetical protein [Bosea sp. FBZP-16]|uniref:hypothetical protein n=1 Tax=Bosea sp. FBZP-16 TaxID=2065382 RepID=UPI000C318F10|nr:hypothetical protein [Bosea sp. FBZP-16]